VDQACPIDASVKQEIRIAISRDKSETAGSLILRTSQSGTWNRMIVRERDGGKKEWKMRRKGKVTQNSELRFKQFERWTTLIEARYRFVSIRVDPNRIHDDYLETRIIGLGEKTPRWTILITIINLIWRRKFPSSSSPTFSTAEIAARAPTRELDCTLCSRDIKREIVTSWINSDRSSMPNVLVTTCSYLMLYANSSATNDASECWKTDTCNARCSYVTRLTRLS